MNYTKVLSRTVIDNTGNVVEIPTLLVEHEGDISPLWSLHNYLIKKRNMSKTKRDRLLQAIGLLLDYMEANYSCQEPQELFASFSQAINSGTINEDGNDPSGLYWLPKTSQTANHLLYELSTFSDWMHKEYGTNPLNPWREATKYEERLNWAAYIHKSYNSFLGHLDNLNEIPETAKRAREVMKRKTPSGDRQVKFFPEDKISELLLEGFKTPGKEDSSDPVEKYNWRDIAITILLHGGGLRLSEPFHIWVSDVQVDPRDPDSALVRVYHPEEGKPPQDLKIPDGKKVNNRAAYLNLKYGLLPRNKMIGLRHAGWKKSKLDDSQQKYMHVHWFPSYWGKLFKKAWEMCLLKRIREDIPDNHPFLFVSFRGASRGKMYSIKSFIKSHKKAVEKIGLTVGKMLGTTPHGHRHAYGQRLQMGDLDEHTIQKAMHHKSPESQEVYTEPTIDQVTRKLAQSSQALENGQQLPMNVDLEAWFNQEQKIQKRLLRGRGKR